MTDQDIFFTHTIVGPRLSVGLGRRLDSTSHATKPGVSWLIANLGEGRFWLDPDWKERWLINSGSPRAGAPWRKPGPVRRWLERYAIALAVAGLMLMGLACAMLAIAFWPSIAMGWPSVVLAQGL